LKSEPDERLKPKELNCRQELIIASYTAYCHDGHFIFLVRLLDWDIRSSSNNTSDDEKTTIQANQKLQGHLRI
jgi:hypothetical protein